MTVPRSRLPFHLLLFLLVGTVTAFAAAWQPSYERAATLALAQDVAHEGEAGALVTATSDVQPLAGEAGPPGGGPVPHLGTFQQDLDRLTSRLGAGAGPRLGAVLGRPVTRVAAVPAAVTDGGAARPYGLDPELQLLYAQDAPQSVRYVEGRAPARPAGDGAGAPVEVALSEQNRQALGLGLGRTFRLDGGPRLRTDAVLVGVFRPVTAGADLWRQHPLLERARPRDTDRGRLVTAAALVDLSGIELLEARSTLPLTVTADYPVTVDPAGRSAAAGRLAELVRASGSFERDAVLAVCGERTLGTLPCALDRRSATPPRVTERLSATALAFRHRAERTEALRSFALAGLLAVAVAAAVAAARLAARREDGALALQRARGASPARTGAARLAETAPAVLLGLLVGGLAAAPVTAPRPPAPPGWPAVAATVLAWIALPVATWLRLREPRRSRPDGDRHRPRRAGGPRRAAEVAAVLLALAVWASVRVRGAGALSDPQLPLLPVLLAVVVAVVLLRVQPAPVRLLAARARAGTGAVALVALARAGRAAAGALTLLVLVLALSQAVFGGLVVHTLQQGREQSAAWRSGADAVLLGPARIADAGAELAALPGVAGTAAVHVQVQDLIGSDGTVSAGAVLADVDPDALLAVAPASPLGRELRGARLPSTVRAAPEDAPELDVLADPGLLARHPDGLLDTGSGPDALRLRIVGTLPADARRDPVLGPLLGERPPGAALVVSARTVLPADAPGRSAVLLRLVGGPLGPLDREQVRRAAAATGATGSPVELRTRAGERDQLDRDGLGAVLNRTFLAAGAGSLTIALLVVVLELVLGARDRARTVSYLRTLGLGGRAAAALPVLELLPLLAAAALGGTALGLLLPAALGPVLDLTAFGGGPAPGPSVDWTLTAALALGLVVLVAAVAALETLFGRRRSPSAVLRLGEAL
ncbi:hypothetical protein Kpho02_06170 [Kitasatospora phosalacinea]|uniref:ABC3 transporter permease protein domain-containing protein n=1 Tax=Kitasatospora phosalacinea TaxID=2065 RepID=A0A9W6Q4J8_9ACTN|nr:hypothetical protein [Kitasatospora phosalacinea]GLW68318.1 hypothetical protein Kpho02_06170 [Kitasatospora phosalacinea]